MYRTGKPICDDSFYDSLEIYLKNNCPNLDMLSRTYDDDPVPTELILKYFSEDYLVEFADTKYRDMLSEDKSSSIFPVRNYRQAHEYMLKFNGYDVVFSTKKDGVNFKGGYKKVVDVFNYVCAMSRGRRGNSIEYPYIAEVAPKHLKLGNIKDDFLEIRGEAIVSDEGVKVISERCKDKNIKFSTPKSTAISMLRTKYSKDLYQYMDLYAFYCPGLSDTVSGTFDKLNELGFKTPEYIKVEKLNVPEDFDEFVPWMDEILDSMYELSKASGTKSDGVVVEYNDVTYQPVSDNQYTDRNIALKISHWSSSLFKGKLIGYKIEQKESKCSVGGIIEPVDTGNGICTDVSMYNADVAINNGAKPGEYIYFIRQSETVSVFVYGNELKNLLNEYQTDIEER